MFDVDMAWGWRYSQLWRILDTVPHGNLPVINNNMQWMEKYG